MSLFYCPECKKQISDKAEACPNCDLPKKYFFESESIKEDKSHEYEVNPNEPDYKNLRNMLISYSRDYNDLFSAQEYISSSKSKLFYNTYEYYNKIIKDPSVKQFIFSHSDSLGYTIKDCNQFIDQMDGLFEKIDRLNNNFISCKLVEYKEYFDGMLKAIDLNVSLDEEQRRAVLADEDYCLLIAAAGAIKTTTMAAKAKYLVEKQLIIPQSISMIIIN